MNYFIKMLEGNSSGQPLIISYSGQSMHPKYKCGDILRVIKINNPNVILWGESYMIVSICSKFALKVIRNIFPHPDENKLVLRSLNRDTYTDIVINKSEIIYLFIIKGKLEINQL